MAGAARPRAGGWIIRHPGADGIEFDAAVTVQDLALTVDHAGLAAAFPQCSSAPATPVELADVAASQFLHQASDGPDLWRLGQQMYLVVHQDGRVPSAYCVEQCVAKQRQVTLPIVVVAEAGQPVVAALFNRLRNTGEVESRLSGHCLRIGGRMLHR